MKLPIWNKFNKICWHTLVLLSVSFFLSFSLEFWRNMFLKEPCTIKPNPSTLSFPLIERSQAMQMQKL